MNYCTNIFRTSISSTITNNDDQRKNSTFNITDACSYAETFALKPNPNYKYFEHIGGDCTNFISQILFAGGLKQTHFGNHILYLGLELKIFIYI